MCVIVVKPKKTELPDITTLQACWDTNPDGAGFAYPYKGRVQIEKGFMNFNAFQKALNNLSKKIDMYQEPIILHFRITSRGRTSAEQCHPFPLSNKVKELNRLKVSTDRAIVHNGTISIDVSKTLNDTQTYIKDELFYLLNKFDINDPHLSTIITNRTNSKLAYIDKRKNIKMFGHFEKRNGCLFSNLYHEWTPSMYWKPCAKNTCIDDYQWDEWDEWDEWEEKQDHLMPLDSSYIVQDKHGNQCFAYDFCIDKNLYLYQKYNEQGERLALPADGFEYGKIDGSPVNFVKSQTKLFTMIL